MTTFSQPQAAPIRWMSAAEISAASGLRADLVVRFIPSTGLSGQLYSDHHIALARLVKHLTDVGTHENVIDAVVRDLRDRPHIDINDKQKSTTWRWATALGAATLVALVVGGVVGGLIGAGDRSTPAAEPAPLVTITAQAPAPPSRTVPARPDAICAQWSAITTDYAAKRADWVKVDPSIPASKWTPEQRAVNQAVIPVLKGEAAELSRLAETSTDPVLRGMLQLEAGYQTAYAERLPNYTQAEDAQLWDAAINLSNGVNSLCSTTVR